LKQRVAEGLLEFVDRRYPGFKALVEYCEVSTPLTVEHFTGICGHRGSPAWRPGLLSDHGRLEKTRGASARQPCSMSM
jgi:hypothetical protein